MTTIVCDTGTCSLKLGVVSDASSRRAPSRIIPNVIGEPTVQTTSNGCCENTIVSNENETDAMKILRKFTQNTPSIGPAMIASSQNSPIPTSTVIGSRVWDFEGNVSLKYPMKKGQVTDWDAMGTVWQSAFSDLILSGEQPRSPLQVSLRENKRQKKMSSGVSFRGSSLVLSESSRMMKRDKLYEQIFEVFEFDRVNVSLQAALVLAARGTNSGLVVDCGEGLTQITPVYEGFVQKQAVRVLEIAGKKVSERLADLMRRSDNNSYKIGSRKCENIKEEYCYLSNDIDEERYVADTTNLLTRKISLPDGTCVNLNRERFLAPEILFEPKYVGDASSDSLGIGSAVVDSIASSAIDLRSGFYKSIILAGGSTCTKGFSNRLKHELRDHDPLVDEIGSRQFLAFQGGCVVAELNAGTESSQWWISRADYLEKGAHI